MIKSKPASPKKKPPERKARKRKEEKNRTHPQRDKQTEPEINHSIKTQSSKTGPDL
jgi:hypothetical protein